MAFVRYSRRRAYEFDTSYDGVMAGLAPDIRFTFNEASGNLSNSGSDTSVTFSLAESSAVAGRYQKSGPSTDAGTGTAIAFRGNDGYYVDSTNSLGDINSGAPSSTGTLCVLFRINTMAVGPYTIFADASGTTEGMQLYANPNAQELVFVTRNGNNTTLQYQATISEAQMEAINTDVFDGDWHMFAVVQGASGKTFYYDGTAVSPTETIGGSADALHWLDDFAGTELLYFGARPDNLNIGFLQGHIDDFAVFDGTELSASEIGDLWTGASAYSTLNARGASEGIAYAIREIIGGTYPDHQLTFASTTPTLNDDWGARTDDFNASAFEGSVHTIEDGPSGPDCSAMRIQPTAYNAGGGHKYDDPHDADWTGHIGSGDPYFIVVFKNDTTASPGWNSVLWSMDLGSTTTDSAGQCIFRILDVSGSARPQLLMRNNANTANFNCQLQLDTEGSIDLYDGNWHWILCYQPADTQGVGWIVDGVHYATGSTYNNQITNGEGVDTWIGDVDTNWTTGYDVGVGYWEYNFGTGAYGWDGSIAYVAFGDGTAGDSVWNTAGNMARLDNAVNGN